MARAGETKWEPHTAAEENIWLNTKNIILLYQLCKWQLNDLSHLLNYLRRRVEAAKMRPEVLVCVGRSVLTLLQTKCLSLKSDMWMSGSRYLLCRYADVDMTGSDVTVFAIGCTTLCAVLHSLIFHFNGDQSKNSSQKIVNESCAHGPCYLQQQQQHLDNIGPGSRSTTSG